MSSEKSFNLRPMLAVDAPEQIEFPIWASPKLDGIRCMIVDGIAVSRTLKPIRNRHVQFLIGHSSLDGLDGELIVGNPTDSNVMQATTSGVMSQEGEPNFIYFVFDYWSQPNIPYYKRYENLKLSFDYKCKSGNDPHVKLLEQKLIYTKEDLLTFESECVKEGYEGVITRRYDSPYKYNRSTAKEQFLLKIKRFTDSEAIIIDFEELQRNENIATIDERGYTKRSSHLENKVPAGVLGAFIVRDIETNIEFKIGTGFTAEQRKFFWEVRNTLVGKLVKYKSFKTGVKVAPRHPTMIAFRDEEDM